MCLIPKACVSTGLGLRRGGRRVEEEEAAFCKVPWGWAAVPLT